MNRGAGRRQPRCEAGASAGMEFGGNGQAVRRGGTKGLQGQGQILSRSRADEGRKGGISAAQGAQGAQGAQEGI